MKFATINDAIDFYRKLAIENPNNSTVLNTLGDLYVKIGDRKEALKYYKQAMEILEKNASYQNAIAIGKKILRYVTKDQETIFKLSKLYTKIGDYGEAIKYVSLLDPETIDESYYDEIIGLLNFLSSSVDSPDVKLRLTRLMDLFREKMETLSGPLDDYDLLGFQATDNDDMPPLLEESTIKIGPDTIIDLSVPGEEVEAPPRKVEPEYFIQILTKLSKDQYIPFSPKFDDIKKLADAGLYKPAIWLIQSMTPEERESHPWKELLLKCFVEAGETEEILPLLDELQDTRDPETMYYIGRAYEETGRKDRALEIYRKLYVYFGEFKDTKERIQKIRSEIE